MQLSLTIFIFCPRDHPVSKMLPDDSRSWFLYALCQQLAHPSKGLLMQTVRIRLRAYQNVFTGSQLVDWLIQNGKANDRCVYLLLTQGIITASLQMFT